MMTLSEREEARLELSEKLDIPLTKVTERMIDTYLSGELFQADTYLNIFES